MPTTPLTASVSTALAVKAAPASHAVPRFFVSWKAMTQTSAPFIPWRRTFTQWWRNGVCSRAPRPHRARHTRSGMGRYEPMLRSGPRPQKSL
jgi:hypothetical protein